MNSKELMEWDKTYNKRVEELISEYNLEIVSSSQEEKDYGAGSGYEERDIYLCPCGKGRIIMEKSSVPGFREPTDYWLQCDECKAKFIDKLKEPSE